MNNRGRACTHCGLKDTFLDVKFLRCSGCRISYFCGTECQKNNWENHKLVCQPFDVASKDIRALVSEVVNNPELLKYIWKIKKGLIILLKLNSKNLFIATKKPLV